MPALTMSNLVQESPVENLVKFSVLKGNHPMNGAECPMN